MLAASPPLPQSSSWRGPEINMRTALTENPPYMLIPIIFGNRISGIKAGNAKEVMCLDISFKTFAAT
jgi:hypothetical protein